MEDIEDKKYLIICLRNGCWDKHDTLVMWGENSNGYELDLNKAGLYTKQEAIEKSGSRDCYISLDTLGITEEDLKFKNDTIEMRIKKTKRICDYINAQIKLKENARNLRFGVV